MFKRIRELHISLAAKCQLLFGAAVVLIIAAALFVPWQRMEQLTGQVNERSAWAMSEATVNQHVAWQLARGRRDPTLAPVLTTAPTTRPTTAAAATEPAPPATVARLVLLRPHVHPAALTHFERRAADFLARDPDADFTSRLYKYKNPAPASPSQGYHYARALRADSQCVRCHGVADWSAPLPPMSDTTPAATEDESDEPASATAPASAPATAPAQADDATAPATTAPSHPSALVGLVSIDMPSQLKESELLLNRIFLLAAALLAATLAVVVFYLITTRLILKPVRVLQDTAEKVSKGDLNIRSHISTGDEFQQLSETFNVMLVNLKESEDQLRAINKSLDLKLGQLAESNLALYESNRLKSEFLANVSHELRTPLNSILGFAELLRDLGAAGDGRGQRYIQNILQSGKNLLELINDLLDLAKIEAGRMEVRSAPLSLPDLFEGLAGILKPLAEKKDLTLAAHVGAGVPIVRTDGPKLQQVLYNFLSNAIKFSPAGGQIDLRAVRAGGEDRTNAVRISVTDHGPGIAPDQQQVIFEKFRQIDGSVTREHGGTGLGLAISKELTQLLSGSIGVASTPGHGATFWIELPLKIQPSTQDVRGRMALA